MHADRRIAQQLMMLGYIEPGRGVTAPFWTRSWFVTVVALGALVLYVTIRVVLGREQGRRSGDGGGT